MNGTPHLSGGCVPSRFTDSPDVALTFDEGVDPLLSPGNWFSNALATPLLPQGRHRQHVAALSVPAASSTVTSSKVQTASPQELHTMEDWIIERALSQCAGPSPTIPVFGGPQAWSITFFLDPSRLYSYHIPVVQVVHRAAKNNNANTGGGFYFAGRAVLLCARSSDLRKIHRRYWRNRGPPSNKRRPGPNPRNIGHVEKSATAAPVSGIFGLSGQEQKTMTMPSKASF